MLQSTVRREHRSPTDARCSGANNTLFGSTIRRDRCFVKSVLSGTLAGSVPCILWRLSTSTLVQGTYSPRLRIPWHSHRITHCTYVLDGSYSEKGSEPEAFVQRGDLLFHPKGEVHCDVVGGEGAHCLNIEFVAGDPLVPALEAKNRRVSKFPMRLRHAARSELSRRLPTEWGITPERSSISIQTAGRLYAAIYEFLWMAVRADLPPWLKKCIDELAKKAPLAPSLRQLATLAELHPTHLVRSFGHHLGQTPGEYIRARRVSRACELLSKKTCGLAEVALACGFCDQAHFGRVFRVITGETPGQYRNRWRERNHGTC
jgi:AraC family transcriptional regulator